MRAERNFWRYMHNSVFIYKITYTLSWCTTILNKEHGDGIIRLWECYFYSTQKDILELLINLNTQQDTHLRVNKSNNLFERYKEKKVCPNKTCTLTRQIIKGLWSNSSIMLWACICLHSHLRALLSSKIERKGGPLKYS